MLSVLARLLVPLRSPVAQRENQLTREKYGRLIRSEREKSERLFLGARQHGPFVKTAISLSDTTDAMFPRVDAILCSMSVSGWKPRHSARLRPVSSSQAPLASTGLCSPAASTLAVFSAATSPALFSEKQFHQGMDTLLMGYVDDVSTLRNARQKKSRRDFENGIKGGSEVEQNGLREISFVEVMKLVSGWFRPAWKPETKNLDLHCGPSCWKSSPGLLANVYLTGCFSITSEERHTHTRRHTHDRAPLEITGVVDLG